MGDDMRNGWKIYWTVVILTITNYLVMVLWSLPKISLMANGKVPFDMRPGGYSFEEALAFLTTIDASGRDFVSKYTASTRLFLSGFALHHTCYRPG